MRDWNIYLQELKSYYKTDNKIEFLIFESFDREPNEMIKLINHRKFQIFLINIRIKFP